MYACCTLVTKSSISKVYTSTCMLAMRNASIPRVSHD